MNDWSLIVLAWIAGAGLGVFFFGGLWLTVMRLPSSRHPAILTLASFFGRIIVTLAGFYFISGGELARLVAALVGFLLARQVLVNRWRPGPAKDAGEELTRVSR